MCFDCTLCSIGRWQIHFCTKHGLPFVFAAFCFVSSLVVAFTWPSISSDLISRRLEIVEGSESYSKWMKKSDPKFLEVYMFNWTNAESREQKPTFTQLGPYVFEKSVLPVEVSFSEERDEVSFNETKTWYFRPDLTRGSLSDVIINANPIAVAAIAKAHLLQNEPEKLILLDELLTIFSTFFVQKTVREWLFDGFTDGLREHLKNESEEFRGHFLQVVHNESFRWFMNPNTSAALNGRFKMYTGTDEIQKLGYLITFNGERFPHLSQLKGDLFPPNFEKEETDIFLPTICEPLTLKRHRPPKAHHPGFKWTGSGFNQPKAKCHDLPKIDVSKCFQNVPIVASLPHFYLAPNSITTKINGMKPNKNVHESFFELDGESGLILQKSIKIQLNLHIRPDNFLRSFHNVSEMLLPMMWYEEKVTANNETLKTIHKIYKIHKTGSWVAITLSLIGIVLFDIGIFSTLKRVVRNRRKLSVLEPDYEYYMD